MHRKPYVFGYEDEPADERPTGFGETSFGHSGLAAVSTVAAAWTASQHSTFDEPSRAFERVQAIHVDVQRRHLGLTIMAGLALIALAVTAGLVFAR